MRGSRPPQDLEFPAPGRYLTVLVLQRAIMLKQLTMRVLGAAIVMIVLSFAPSFAKAHGGHEHHASVHGGQGQVALLAASHESGPSVTSASLQQAQWKQAELPPASDRNCTGDCCLSACAACCAAGLPSPVAFVSLAQAITRVAFAPSRMWPDRVPESLRRPPKYFI
jgi:hypothetical protein